MYKTKFFSVGINNMSITVAISKIGIGNAWKNSILRNKNMTIKIIKWKHEYPDKAQSKTTYTEQKQKGV